MHAYLDMVAPNHIEGAYFIEGHLWQRPLYFNGNHYSHWKERMKIFFQSTNYLVWDKIVSGPRFSTTKEGNPKPRSEWIEDDVKMVQTNARAINILYCAVSGAEYDKSLSSKMWNKLQVTHEGMDKIKETKMNILSYELELFYMNEGENIKDMFERFAKIIWYLKALGRTYTLNEQGVRILRCLPLAWSKVNTIESSSNLKELTYDELHGMLDKATNTQEGVNWVFAKTSFIFKIFSKHL